MGRVLARLGRGARRIGGGLRRARPLTVIAAVLVIAVAGTAIYRSTRTAASPSTIDNTVRVGVHDGDSVPAYTEQSRARLAALTGSTPVYALVSLTGYVDPAAVARLSAGVDPVFALARDPIPDRQTELVRLATTHPPDDLRAAMRALASRKDTDARGSTNQAAAQSDPRLRALKESDAALEQAESQDYRNGCTCVYALVVRAAPATLRALAGRDGVRIVDPAPEVSDAVHAVFVAPLPEQVDLVVPPADTGVPPS
jgi:hypothetical protein